MEQEINLLKEQISTNKIKTQKQEELYQLELRAVGNMREQIVNFLYFWYLIQVLLIFCLDEIT